MDPKIIIKNLWKIKQFIEMVFSDDSGKEHCVVLKYLSNLRYTSVFGN